MCRRRYGHFIFIRPGGFYTDSKITNIMTYPGMRKQILQCADVPSHGGVLFPGPFFPENKFP